ncbi:hypothetical protein D3C83_264480 [compost metagenome]
MRLEGALRNVKVTDNIGSNLTKAFSDNSSGGPVSHQVGNSWNGEIRVSPERPR